MRPWPILNNFWFFFERLFIALSLQDVHLLGSLRVHRPQKSVWIQALCLQGPAEKQTLALVAWGTHYEKHWCRTPSRSPAWFCRFFHRSSLLHNTAGILLLLLALQSFRAQPSPSSISFPQSKFFILYAHFHLDADESQDSISSANLQPYIKVF